MLADQARRTRWCAELTDRESPWLTAVARGVWHVRGMDRTLLMPWRSWLIWRLASVMLLLLRTLGQFAGRGS
jgi:hypothetical protein